MEASKKARFSVGVVAFRIPADGLGTKMVILISHFCHHIFHLGSKITILSVHLILYSLLIKDNIEMSIDLCLLYRG